jgi:UDP-3-O-[3-hydroxymyristoyl] glucosamine N-acyltransferase
MKLSFIAKEINGTLIGEDLDVTSLRSLLVATDGDLTLLLDKKSLKDAQETPAKAIISYTKDVAPKNIILVENPRSIFAKAVKLFKKAPTQSGTSDKSSIHPSASIGNNCTIASFVTIGERVSIGDNTVIHSGVKIYDYCTIGSNCLLHCNAVIGADGFGFEPNQEKSWDKVPQLGAVILEDNVEVGANSCIDRGTLQDTLVKEGTKIDNLVQIGHNCIIGRHNVISSSTAIAGSTIVGDYCMWGGQSGATGHMTIGDNVVVMARAGITKDIPDNMTVYGYPAREHKQSQKEEAFLRRWLKRNMNKRVIE